LPRKSTLRIQDSHCVIFEVITTCFSSLVGEYKRCQKSLRFHRNFRPYYSSASMWLDTGRTTRVQILAGALLPNLDRLYGLEH